MNCLIPAVVVCVVISDSTAAIDQHLICKLVDDVFSSDDQIQSGRLQGPLRHNRPGKQGPKGSKGDRGRDGTVDYSLVNGTVEEAVALATAKLQAKVEKLESEIRNITDLFSKLDISALQAKVETTATITMTTSPLYSGDCTDGIVFGAKCYFVIVQRASSRSHGERICRENNGELGNIVSLEHQTLVMDYMRGKIPDGRSEFYVWTAPKYKSSTRTVRLSNGRSLSASTLRWYPNYPSGSSTGIGLQINSDASHSNQRIFNFPETNSLLGVLCEK